MALNAEPVELAAILPFREAYRREMDCQIVHDSIHARAGWSREFLLRAPDLSELRRYELGEKLAAAYRSRLTAAGHMPPPGLTSEALLAGVASARA